jgi:hypothetical protein
MRHAAIAPATVSVAFINIAIPIRKKTFASPQLSL